MPGTIALTGTMLADQVGGEKGSLEPSIVTGGNTCIMTLTGGSWQPIGAAFDAVRQSLLDSLVSATSEAAGWNATVIAAQPVTAVVRTSDQVVTITFVAVPGFNIVVKEGPITASVPDNATVPNVTGTMRLNVNLNWIATYDGGVQFANILKQGRYWSQITGTGAFTEVRGTLTPTVATDEFHMVLSDQGQGLPAGTYTILNPNGDDIAVGAFSNATAFSPWSTATQVSFTYNGEANGLIAIWCRGLQGASPGLAVILPGHLTSYQAGDEWYSSFISFLSAMNMNSIRFMNSNQASYNIETEWADRMPSNSVSFSDRPYTLNQNMPWEFMIDLANKLNIDPWVCLPHRCSDTYAAAFANLFNTNLNAGLNVYLEVGNETWNNGNPWSDGTHWFRDYQFTRLFPVPNSNNNRYTLNGHGFANGDKLVNYSTKENRDSGVNLDFRIQRGGEAFIKVFNNNQFSLSGSNGGADISIPVGMVNSIASHLQEAGKIQDTHGEFGKRCVAIWDIIDPILTAARVKKIMPSQFGNPQSGGAISVSTARFAAPGVTGRADFLSVAPYFKGGWWGTRAILSTGAVSPQVWANTNRTIYMGLYSQGSTPTNSQIKAGTGAIASQSLTNSFVSNNYRGFTQITGLTNGVSYELFFIYIDPNGNDNIIQIPFTATATATNVNGNEPFAVAAARIRTDIDLFTAILNNHIAAANGTPNIMYEGGAHLSENAPATIDTWLTNFTQDIEFTNLTTYYYQVLSAVNGNVEFFHYKDMSEGGSWGYTNNYDNITDPRYVNRLALGNSI